MLPGQQHSVSPSKPAIKRHFHEWKYRGFASRCKTLITLKNKTRKVRLENLPSSREGTFFENGWMKPRSICIRMMRGERYEERKRQLMIQSTTFSVKHGGGSVIVWVCMELGPFPGNVTANRRSMMNSEDYRTIPSDQIQTNAGKLTGLSFAVWIDYDPKHTVKATQQFLMVKMAYSSTTKSNLWSMIIDQLLKLLKAKLKTEGLTSKSQLKAAAVKALESISREETQHLLMPRLQAVIVYKGLQTKY